MHTTEDLIIQQHAPLVRRLALQLTAKLPACVELDDLIQAGMIGLVEAVRRYQVSPDAQFKTYATVRIRGAMLDELRAQDWLPRSIRTKAKRIEDAVRNLTQRTLRPPTEAEIAVELGLDLAQYQTLLEEAHGVQIVHSEDLARQADAGEAFDGVVHGATQHHCPLEQLLSQSLRTALIAALEQLPEREKLILSLQFEQNLNQREIARVLDLTEGRVSQLRTQAVARIRATLGKSAMADSPGEDVLAAPVALFTTDP